MPFEAPLAAKIRALAEDLKARRPPAEGSLLEAPATPVSALIAEYRHVLGRLWLLSTPPTTGAVDVAEARGLLADQARLCDELGPEVAAAVGRQHARAWARTMGRCPWCGMAAPTEGLRR